MEQLTTFTRKARIFTPRARARGKVIGRIIVVVVVVIVSTKITISRDVGI